MGVTDVWWLLFGLLTAAADEGQGTIGWGAHPTIEYGSDQLVFGAVFQPRLDGAVVDDEVFLSSYVRRVRLVLKGTVFEERVGFKFQAAWDRAEPSLKDAFVTLRLADDTRLYVGQHKRPFSRQFLTSGTAQALVERAITHDAFAIDRDVGLQLHHDRVLEAAVGVYDGSEDPVLMAHPVVVGRLGAHTAGMDAYDMVDFEGGGARIAGAVQALADFDLDDDDVSELQAGADAMLKVRGLTLESEGYLAFVGDGDFGDTELSTVGAHLEGSWLLAERVAPAARVARVEDLQDDVGATEVSGGVGLYVHQHALSWKNAVGVQVFDEEDDLPFLRSQLQLLL